MGDAMGANVTPRLTPRQRRAIETLTAGGQVTEAAEVAKVARKTVHAWLKRDDFRAALAEAETEKLAALSRALGKLAERAADTLGELLDDPTTTPTVRVRAFDVVMGRLLQLRELVTLSERVAALEDKIGGRTWRKR